MYTDRNYKTKKALRDDFNNGEQITVYQPGDMFESKKNGSISLKGPHYPHWYASAQIVDGVIVKLDGKAPKLAPKRDLVLEIAQGLNTGN